MGTATQEPHLQVPEREPTDEELAAIEAANEAAASQEAPADDLFLEAGGQLSLDVGGKQPTTSSLRLVGGKVELGGAFRKGEVVRLYVECVVGEVAFRDSHDGPTGQVVATDRAHKARIVGVRLAD